MSTCEEYLYSVYVCVWCLFSHIDVQSEDLLTCNILLMPLYLCIFVCLCVCPVLAAQWQICSVTDGRKG